VIRGQPLLEIDGDANHVRLLVPPEAAPIPLEHALRLVSPKILAARDHLVLHASTCEIGGGLIAFCGASGAGKSTVASLLGGFGAAKRTDELLVVSMTHGVARGHPDAEKEAYAWCAAGARTLATGRTNTLACADLGQVARQPALPLAKLVFLDAGRRGAGTFETEVVPPAQAVPDLLLAAFLGRREPGKLRRFFADCQQLGALVPIERARPPAGLGALADALRDYRTKIAS
jgi:hypothetical protein